ncbi:MAG: Ger(x)C family spore germination protein [Peptococcaceae bacterium]|nr:Ger(x)C family spore germination protein [Peptococcaceae bacterium]
MGRKVTLMLLLALLPPLLVGCWSSREVESMAFVMALGVDVAKEGVQLTVQVALPAGGGGGGGGAQGGETPVWVTGTTAPSIAEGLFKMPAMLGREAFLGHLQVVVVGEAYALQGIGPLIDFLARERQVRDTVHLAVALGKAEDLLMVEPKVVQMPADYMFELLKQGAQSGLIPPSEFLRTRIAWHNRPQLQILLPLLEPEPNSPPEAISLKGSGVFVDDRMVGTLDTKESRGLAWLMGTVSNTIITIPREEGNIIQHVNFASVRYKLRETDEGAGLTAIVSQDGNLTQWPLQDEGITFPLLKQLEQDLSVVILGEITAGLAAIQGVYRTDVIGLGERLRRIDPKQFAAKNWDEAFPQFALDVRVQAAFRRVGLILR